ncbi:hypothetical protein [Kitasatospora sp. NPDC018619]|uniref:hypothetical protein n=1 Tax=unclassified Kitasatospora TaxID=2633591 RepID=UPI0037B4A510
MNGITWTLRALHHGESELAAELLTVAQRHRTEHEIHHVATDIAHWSRIHARKIAGAAAPYGLHLHTAAPHTPHGIVAVLREKLAEAVGHRPEPGLLLLRDLRHLYLGASENSLHWEMLAQAAQAGRETPLLDLATACHPQTLRQIRWTNTMIKNLSPQILTSL